MDQLIFMLEFFIPTSLNRNVNFNTMSDCYSSVRMVKCVGVNYSGHGGSLTACISKRDLDYHFVFSHLVRSSPHTCMSLWLMFFTCLVCLFVCLCVWTYHKVLYKSCCLCALFRLFGQASIQDRLMCSRCAIISSIHSAKHA